MHINWLQFKVDNHNIDYQFTFMLQSMVLILLKVLFEFLNSMNIRYLYQMWYGYCHKIKYILSDSIK